MAQQKSEYKVIEESNAARLGAQLNALGAQGWRPILMTSASPSATPSGVITTVILEHVLGS